MSEIDSQNDHVWFREHIAVALANGLGAAEQMRFEAHAASCETCAAELASAREMERNMTAMFAMPAAGLEDRLIARLRDARRNWRPRLAIHPAVARAGAMAAAVMLLAGAGYFVSEIAQPMRSERRPVATNLRQPGESKSVGWEKNPFRGSNRDNISFGKDAEVTGNYSIAVPGLSAGQDERRGGNLYWDVDGAQTKSGSGTLSLSAGTIVEGAAVNKPADAVTHYFSDYSGPTAGEKGSGIASNATTWFEPTSLGRAPQAQVESRFARHDDYDFVAGVPGAAAAKPVAPEGTSGVDDLKRLEELTRKGKTVAGDGLEALKGERAELGLLIAKAPAPVQQQPPPTEPKPPVEQAAVTARKVIRNGQMEFEVDRFDAAFAQVSKLTTENGGYVGTTDSEKLPNGKVKGTVLVRVPPDRLDTLVLQLRGIGDLKSQKLEAQDISKQYTDLESGLRAAKAMEERLMQIIKEGKGAIKDLLAAEKELGVWREKVEQITGEMRYYDNLVSLSTLKVTLFERDIQTAAKATETETIDAGLETVDVENARAEALKAIEEAKGRVIQSDLKRFDAGQFGATIVAEVPPDASGPLLDRIRQIGKVARLDIQQKQTADSNQSNTATNAPPKVEKRDTRLNLSLYNLANVAPRQSSVINIAADDVEKVYQTILARVTKAGGRIVTSNIARSKPEQTTGAISFETPTNESDAVMNDLRALGEVMKLSVVENPDVNNVTTAKRGFSVSLVSAAAVAPRETASVQVASTNVGSAREKILSAASSGGARVLTSQLNENDRSNPNATLEIDVPRKSLAAVEKTLAESGDTISRVVTRSSDTENTIDSKVKLQVTLLSAEKLPPREMTAMTIELSDVDSAITAMQQAAADAGGRVTEQNMSRERDGSSTGKIAVEVPLDKAAGVVDQAKKLGAVRAVSAAKNQQVPAGALARARIDLTFGTADTIVEPGRGVWATIRNGLSTSVSGLLWSLQLIVIGLCFVLPWALVVWAGWKLVKRRKPAPVTAT